MKSATKINSNGMTSLTTKHRSLITQILLHKYFYLMLLPAVLYFAVFKYAPMYGVLLAFKQFSFRVSLWDSKWVGMQNFEALFGSSAFRQAALNTIIISFGRILFTFAIPIVIALLLNELHTGKFKKVVQTTMYLPHFLSWVIISGIALSMLTINGGFVNKILVFLGMQPINFLLEETMFRPLLYISAIWKEAGWETIIYIAALAGINPELYEAATVDGAGRFSKMLHITWPGVSSTVVIMLILTISRMMYAGMDQIINLYSAPVYGVADIIDTYAYRELLLKSEFGLGTAAGLFQSGINLVLVLVTNKVAKLINEEGGLF